MNDFYIVEWKTSNSNKWIEDIEEFQTFVGAEAEAIKLKNITPEDNYRIVKIIHTKEIITELK